MSNLILSEEESYMPKARSNNVFYDSSSEDEVVVYHSPCNSTEKIQNKKIDNDKSVDDWTGESETFVPIFPKTEFELEREKLNKERNNIAANRKFKLCSDFESKEPEPEVEELDNDYSLVNYLENSEKERLANIEKEVAKEALILEEKRRKEEEEINLLLIEKKKIEERDRIIEELERDRKSQQEKEEREFKLKQDKLKAKAEKIRIKREEEKSKKFNKDNKQKEEEVKNIVTKEIKEPVSVKSVENDNKEKENEAKIRKIKLQTEFKDLIKKYPNITRSLNSSDLNKIRGYLNRRETILFNLFLSGKLDISEKKTKVEVLTDQKLENNRKTSIILSKLHIGCHIFRSIAALYYPMKNLRYCEELDKVDTNQFCFHDLRFDPSLNDIVIKIKRKEFEWCSLTKSNYTINRIVLSDTDKKLLLLLDLEKLKTNTTKEFMRLLKKKLILKIRNEEIEKEYQDVIFSVHDILNGYNDQDYASKYRSVKYIKDRFKLLTDIEAEFYDIKNIENSTLGDIIRQQIEESVYKRTKDFSTMKIEEQRIIQRVNKIRVVNSDKYKNTIKEKELVDVRIKLYKLKLELKTKEIFAQTTFKNLKNLREKKEKKQNQIEMKIKHNERIKKSRVTKKIRRTIKKIINLKIHNIKRENIRTHEMLSVIHDKSIFDKLNFDYNEEFIKRFLEIINKTILLKSSYDTLKENSNLNGLLDFKITTENKIQQIEFFYYESEIITPTLNYDTLKDFN